MIRPDQIPDEVVEALAGSMNCRWALQSDEDKAVLRKHIAAALAAWPGALVEWHSRGPGVILPLPEAPQERGVSTENSDE